MLRKTVLLLLVMALSVTAVMAVDEGNGYAEGAKDPSSGWPVATTKVAFNPGSAESAIVKVAFTDDGIIPDDASDVKKSVNLAIDPDEGTTYNVATNSEDALYATWDITYGGTLNIYLEIASPLTHETENTNTINWSVSVPEKGEISSESASEEKHAQLLIGEHDGSTDSGISTDSGATGKQITIKTTENFDTGKPTGSYSALLYLTVEDVGAGA